MTQVPQDHVVVGRVAGAWGVRGVLTVIPFVDKREQLAPGRAVTVAAERRTIESARWRSKVVHLKLSGIDDRESALALRNQFIIVPTGELEPLAEGQYYRFQIIGLAVSTTQGEPLGSVTEVLPTGANDVYVVRGDRGEILVPATDEVIKEIDLEAGRMVIEELPGLIPEPRRKG